MNLLAIDTSTDHATVALAFGNELLSEEQGSMRQHAQFLLPMVERLLTSASLSFSQLDGIVFGCGPGSFTGLRIACSVAKAFAFAHDLLAFIYWLYKRRADQEPALGYIADLLYTAVIAADLRAFNRHEYRRKPEESDLDVSAAYHALPDRLVTTFRRVRF